MANLWTFGDSLTDYFTPPNDVIRHWRHKYIEWKGYSPKVYGELLSEKLEINLKNKAISGNNNNQIFEEFCKNCTEINEDDILIFGWSNQERFRLVNKNGGWTSIYGDWRSKDKKEKESFLLQETLDILDSISKETIQQLLLNRMHESYRNELYNWIKLINTAFKNNKIIHWSWDERLSENIITIPLNKFENIDEETNGVLKDKHWSEKGQKDMSNFLLDIIQNKNDKKSLL